MSRPGPDRYVAPQQVRHAIREGRFRGPTMGIATRFVQCNVAIVPNRFAGDFARFCALNEQACPVLARSDPGDPALPALGDDIDIRTDLPAYSVIRDGRVVASQGDIKDLWRDDFVTFAFGCSFSFEQVLVNEGVGLGYRERGDGPALFITAVETRPAGVFSGKLAVSMRPLRPAEAIRAIIVTSQYPKVHGAPVHIGNPAAIGIEDLARPLQSLGGTRLLDDELPVFWACGVTAQLALQAARLPLCITHASAHMLVTDVPLDRLKQAISPSPQIPTSAPG